MDLIDWLRARQAQLGLTDRDFARLLGVHHATWWRWSNRRRGVTGRSAGPTHAALRAWPADRDAILALAHRMPVGIAPMPEHNEHTGSPVAAGTAA